MDEEYNDYDIPFDGMSEDEFLYRAMDENDPLYMGPDDEPSPDDFDDWD